jgi:hypothetical protein
MKIGKYAPFIENAKIFDGRGAQGPSGKHLSNLASPSNPLFSKET